MSSRIPTHLILRKGVYSYRRRVPQHLRHRPVFGGKDVFQVSLGVRTLAEARREVQARGLDRLFEPDLSPLAANDTGTVLSVALLRQIAEDNYRRGVRGLIDQAPESDERLIADEHAAQEIGSLNNPAVAERTSAIIRRGMGDVLRAQAEGVATRLGIQPTGDAIRKIEDALFQSEIGLRGARLEIASGNPFPAWTTGGAAATGAHVPTVREAHWNFKKLAEAAIRQRRVKPGWEHKVRTAADLFSEHIGEQTPVHEITRRKIQDFVNDLAFMPRSMSLRFPGMTLQEAIAANEAREKPFPVATPNTIRDNYFSVVRWVLNYAVELDALPSNPAREVKVANADKGRRATRKPQFKVEELNALFRQPVFAGCASAERPNTPGSFKFDDHRKWVPLLMLFSGARPSEIAQLAVSDVRDEEPVPYISILTEYDPDDPDDRPFVLSHKTANARREIPIHPTLVELGFLAYVRARREAGDIRLFPSWAASKNPRKLYSAARWIRNINEKVIPAITARKPKPTLYSLRHTWKTLMAAQHVPTQFQNQLLGHAQSGMDENYLHDLGIENLYDAIKTLNHKELDLSHLKRGAED